MNIQLLSDLHLEFEDFNYLKLDSDVVVLAGDIDVKDRGVRWAIENIKDKPVIYVLGNHEYYGKAYPKLIGTLKDLCQGTNVHVLEDDHIVIDGVNFLGATLWTDFELYGDPRLAGAKCQEVLTDYRKIKILPTYGKIRSIDIAGIHRQSKLWLNHKLVELNGKINVVVTHHGCSELSVPEQFIGDEVTAAYVSDLESMITQHQPRLWLHGHLHNSSDYKIGACRVVCNPKGYPGELNDAFNEKLIVSL